MTKQLYVSDMDGTLLDKKGALSEYSRQGLKRLLAEDVAFTVASARAYQSISSILQGIPFTLPIIEFNGAYITDFSTGRHLITQNISSDGVKEIADFLRDCNRNYFLSTFDGKEDRLYYSKAHNQGEAWYIDSRTKAGDPRFTCIEDIRSVLDQQVVCFTMIDKKEALLPLQEALSRIADLEIHLQYNEYSGWWWLTLHSHRATKDQAIRRLQKEYGLEDYRLTVFGDNHNDMKMLRVADNPVAPENALPEVKALARRIVSPHYENGVVQYMIQQELS